jgi:hypothetical protein
MHIPKNKSKKERSIKQIPCRGDETLATTTPSPHKKKNRNTLTSTKYNTEPVKRFSKSDASKKETMHKYCRRLIKDLEFSP